MELQSHYLDKQPLRRTRGLLLACGLVLGGGSLGGSVEVASEVRSQATQVHTDTDNPSPNPDLAEVRCQVVPGESDTISVAAAMTLNTAVRLQIADETGFVSYGLEASQCFNDLLPQIKQLNPEIPSGLSELYPGQAVIIPDFTVK